MYALLGYNERGLKSVEDTVETEVDPLCCCRVEARMRAGLLLFGEAEAEPRSLEARSCVA